MSEPEESDQLPEEGPGGQVPDDDSGTGARDDAAGSSDPEARSAPASQQRAVVGITAPVAVAGLGWSRGAIRVGHGQAV